MKGWAILGALALTSSQLSLASSSLHVRGGVSYEQNPNYVFPPSRYNGQTIPRPVTLGDLEKGCNQPRQEVWIDADTYNGETPKQKSEGSLSIQNIVFSYFQRLNQSSPTLAVTSLACISVYILWQVPACRGILGRHLVCSRSNLWSRPHSVLLSAVSHASFTHILMNLMGFVSLGPPLLDVLKTYNWPLWPLVLGAALSGSFAFLLKGNGACMGLSGVTLSMLALQAKLFPDRQLGMVVAVFPIRLKAKFALVLLLAISVLGSLDRNSRVAHFAHLGGLLFGMAYYEAWIRRRDLRHWYWKNTRLWRCK